MPSSPHRSTSIPRIGDVMTPFPYSIDIDRPVGDVGRMLSNRGIHHLPVTSNGEVYSVVSTRDVELALARPDADEWGVRVREICAQDPLIVDIRTALDAVLDEMIDRQTDCVVVAENDRVAGIFTMVDACRRFAAWLRGDVRA
jgi:acetoin utilization protein AcuB